jgi:hypothetical protein
MTKFGRMLALALLGLATALPGGDAHAIDGVTYNAQTGHYYKVYTDARTWASAKAEAERLEGYLCVITTSAENSFVLNTLNANHVWIGATDETSEGTWAWVNGEAWSYTAGNSGEPNDAAPGGEDWLEIKNGGWNDERLNHNQGYVVEWDTDPNISTPPEAPTGLSATAVTDRRVDLTWTDASLIEDNVEVERSIDGGAYTRIAQLDKDSTSYSDTAARGGTDHSYRVRMTNIIGAGEYSNVATVTTPPSPLQDLAGTSPTPTSVRLTWTDATDEETGIIVERGLGCPAASFTQIATLAADTTEYDDEGLEIETTYSYRLRATRAAGSFEYTLPVCVRTPPAAPAGFAPSVTVGSDVTLTWFDDSDGETGYEVERGIGCPAASFVLLATLPPDSEKYVDGSTEPESTYEYRVRAINESGGSAWTPVACVTTPPYAPVLRSVDVISSARVKLMWDDVSSVEDGFRVMRANFTEDGVDAPFRQVVDLPPGATEYLDESLSQDGSYAYRVAAFDDNGQSDWAVSDDLSTPAVLLVKKATLKAAKGKKPARLTITGEIDVGSRAFDLTQPAVLAVGAGAIVMPSLTKKGPRARYTADGVLVDLKPGKGTSRVAYKLIVSGDAAAAVDADGELRLAFEQGGFSGLGIVLLEKGKFQPGKSGRLLDPPLRISSISAKMKSGPKDVVKVKSTFDVSGGMPDVAPDVHVLLGFFEFEVTGDQFTKKGSRFLFSEKVFGARKVTLDYAKGTISLSVGGVEVGVYNDDGIPIRFALELGSLRFVSQPVFSVNKGSMKY